jgi:hypothetical protein
MESGMLPCRKILLALAIMIATPGVRRHRRPIARRRLDRRAYTMTLVKGMMWFDPDQTWKKLNAPKP